VLVQQVERLCEMYADKVQSIGGLCSAMSLEEPSVDDYLNWLSAEVTGLSDMFSGVNENFATVAIEGVSHWPVIWLTLKLCELPPSKVVRMFYSLCWVCRRLLGLYQRNGGGLSPMTMC
jgi:hypothetical protein